MLFTILLACSGNKTPVEDTGPDPYDVPVGPYSVDIRWTSYGIPHILAEDYGSLGYGMGYAFAKDHYCILMDQIIRVQGERSKYLGDEYINEDFGWSALKLLEGAEASFLLLSDDIQKQIIGYAAGYNRYRAENPEGLADWCRDEPWLRDVNHIDLLSYYNALGLKASSENLITNIGEAQPPSWPNSPVPPNADTLSWTRHLEMGSNGWVLGKDKTESGKGMMLSNTHFPFRGERMWHESHLTIPGELNVYGASLMGVPVINLGFNEHVAWTHTVSQNPRFVFYTLNLEDGDPTSYLYDGDYIDMEEENFSIEVLEEDGSLRTETRTLYRSRYGWMINAPIFGWPDTVGFTFQDINEDNSAIAATWLGMGKATSLEEFKSAIESNMGIPWVHTLAVQADGNIWYGDAARTPNFTAEAEQYYLEQELQNNPFSDIFSDYGVIAVSGDNPLFALDRSEHPDGIEAFENIPQMDGSEYFINANDNHWLSNASTPLTGYSAFYGAEESPRTPRTRMNLRSVEEGGDDGLFSLLELQQTALSGRAILAEDLLASVITRCASADLVEVEFEEETQIVSVVEACTALSSWDGLTLLDSQGAHVWREMLGAGILTFEDLLDARQLYAVSFNPADPLDTPTGLAPAPEDRADPLLQSLAIAVLRLEQANIAMDAPLGDIQFQKKNGQQIPIMGNVEFTGGMSIAVYSGSKDSKMPREERAEVLNDTTDLTKEGYQVNYGNSWMLTVEFTDDGPQAEAVMTYSQSSNPESPHYQDQSTLYSDSSFRDVAFTEEEIAADPNLETIRLELE